MQQKGQEDRDRIVSVSRWHLWDDDECTAEQFQWSGVYNRLIGEDLEGCLKTEWSVKQTLAMRSIIWYKRQLVRDWPIVWQLVFVQGRFVEEGKYCRFFKNGMESTRAEREINNVCNCGDEYRRTFSEKPSAWLSGPNQTVCWDSRTGFSVTETHDCLY